MQVIERVLATLYIHDYESKRRLHISIILRLSVVGFSLFLALELTYGANIRSDMCLKIMFPDLLKLTYIVYLGLILCCASVSAMVIIFSFAKANLACKSCTDYFVFRSRSTSTFTIDIVSNTCWKGLTPTRSVCDTSWLKTCERSVWVYVLSGSCN